jgi:hypothetical protein
MMSAEEFYRKYCVIKTEKGIERPHFRDSDKAFFELVDKIVKSGKSLMYVKRKNKL